MPRLTKNFRIEEDAWARFYRASVQRDTTPSRLLRRLVLDFLDREHGAVLAEVEAKPTNVEPPAPATPKFRPVPKKR